MQKKLKVGYFPNLFSLNLLSQMTTMVAWGSNDSVQLGVGKKAIQIPSSQLRQSLSFQAQSLLIRIAEYTRKGLLK